MEAAATNRAMTVDADRDLVERHRRGEEAAFAELYGRYGAMVFNVALRLSGNPDEATDLTQETFLKIHRHLGGFRGRSALRTWIYRVAINCCRSRYRRQQTWHSRFELGSGATLEQVADRRRDPEQRAIARSTGEVVQAALEALPLVYREAVILREIEGLAYGEIAEVLGVRVGTVRSRIARGRERLRSLLEDSR